ncbi:glycosyl transferase family 8 [Catellatospora sp. TT07R-123]|uniref:glycosyltransferase family 8 protein n=1 Tax=Catellatospora sp. TT07R-123 TaxID=2733863 RepID=UPI001B0EC184|nr:glycosyltransferase family 8 protein [Catellatospora sp. TT07R-123]GHJ47638.1 glycosyl transferase family 8 [Catellatospora sp. TT07R-123]
MDIAFAFDEAYAGHARVALESVLDRGERDDVTFWLLTTDQVAKEQEPSLRRQLAGRGRLHLLTAGDAFRSLPVAELEAMSWLTPGMYLRLLLPDLVDGPDRLLYLDADVHVCGDLGPLWQVPLDGVPLAAVRDAFADRFDAFGGIPGSGPEHPADAPYFNSGVILINLPQWRELDVTERCLAYLAENGDRLRFPDQDALNLVAYERWRRLPPRWNHMCSYELEPMAASERAAQDVRIMHFAGPRKPWTEGFRPGFRQQRHRDLAARVAAFA